MDELSRTASAGSVFALLTDELAERLLERIAERLPSLLRANQETSTPWLTTTEAIAYTKLPEGTFRKLAACGKIPSHGGRTKLFYRPELDQALLGCSGIAAESRALRRVQ
ncbi:MAG: hypothetical protein JO342_05330 [Solirubrobacterales bacterium]|nr:hypothetical protein [Solirubrobacterales bacterium]MBV9165555.1 hypothetical protein [Solirubrobacterales bacterium]